MSRIVSLGHFQQPSCQRQDMANFLRPLLSGCRICHGVAILLFYMSAKRLVPKYIAIQLDQDSIKSSWARSPPNKPPLKYCWTRLYGGYLFSHNRTLVQPPSEEVASGSGCSGTNSTENPADDIESSRKHLMACQSVGPSQTTPILTIRHPTLQECLRPAIPGRDSYRSLPTPTLPESCLGAVQVDQRSCARARFD